MSTAYGTPLPSEVPPTTGTAPGLKRPSGLRFDAALGALGVGLLVTAVVISAVYTRQDGDLDWSNYAVGLGATAALLLVGVLGRGAVKDRELGRAFASWPLAFGGVAAGLMVAVGLEDVEQIEYLVGGVIAALGVLGYLAAPSAAPALTTVLGLLFVYIKAVEDVDVFDSNEGSFTIVGALVVTVFVVGVTVLAAPLRPARVVVGVTAGFGAVLGFFLILSASGFFGFFGGFASPVALGDDDGGADYYMDFVNDLENDVYVVLALAGALVLMWLVLAQLTDAVGYRILVVAMCVTVVPVAMAVILVEHPTWWGAVAAVAGGLVLGFAGLRSVRAARGSTPPPSSTYTPPPTPSSGTPAHGTPPAPPSYLGGS